MLHGQSDQIHTYRCEVMQFQASTCWASDSGARGRSRAGSPRPACLGHAASRPLRKPAHWQLGLRSLHQMIAEPEAQVRPGLPQECLTSEACCLHSGATVMCGNLHTPLLSDHCQDSFGQVAHHHDTCKPAVSKATADTS